MDTADAKVLRVLVIEDDADDQVLLMRQLHKADIADQVKFIADGSEAVAFFRKKHMQIASSVMVIFLDLKLPGVGGLEVLRTIKRISSLNRIPVILMTSPHNLADLETCQSLGVMNYVEKPVTYSAFSKAMADVFHLSSRSHGTLAAVE
jgi:two-component system, response regulator